MSDWKIEILRMPHEYWNLEKETMGSNWKVYRKEKK